MYRAFASEENGSAISHTASLRENWDFSGGDGGRPSDNPPSGRDGGDMPNFGDFSADDFSGGDMPDFGGMGANGGIGANGGMGAYGGMGGSSDSATEVVNSAIDNAFSGTEFFDTLMENETYRKQYYAYLSQLVEEYVYGDGFETFYNRTRNLIDSLVETDPTAFYTYEEYQTAADTLYQIVKLRAQSIEGQLDGTIPSTSKEQTSSDALIDASSLSVSAMGTMNTGGQR